jgi:hypothetical protein
MEIALRLLREFWLPALLAAAWTAFNLYSTTTWDLKAIINVFGPSFFLASWATGQFFRIKKQVGVDRNLTNIEARVTTLVERLEKHTTDFVGHATGGDSYASFLPSISRSDVIELMLSNQSKYPVFDIFAEAIDLDEPIDPEAGKFWTRRPFVLRSIYPGKAVMGAYSFDVRGKNALNVNVFVQSRNKGLIQQFRVARVGDWFSIAIRTTVEGEVVQESIPDNFPLPDPANPKSIFG